MRGIAGANGDRRGGGGAVAPREGCGLSWRPPTVLPQFEVQAVDIAVLLVYVLGTRIVFGWLLAKRVSKGSEAYFLAGKHLKWPLIGMSFYVSNMSGSSFVGLPGSGYNDGVAVYNYEWPPAPILVFFVVFLLPFYLRAAIRSACCAAVCG